MKILPLDIKGQEFRKSVRGYSPSEVKTFLEVVAQAFEELIKENNSLKDELRRHINQINDYREKESTLKETMLTAQKISDDIKTSSKKEAELTVREAEMKSEKIVNDAHQKMIQIMDRIEELKLDRIRFISSFKSVLEQHTKLLESIENEKDLDKKELNFTYIKSIKGRTNEP